MQATAGVLLLLLAEYLVVALVVLQLQVHVLDDIAGFLD
jgi:hypothetical protein